MIIFKYILEVVKRILNIKFLKFEHFEILLDNRYISFNINAAKDDFKTNEPLLSLRYNLFNLIVISQMRKKFKIKKKD